MSDLLTQPVKLDTLPMNGPPATSATYTAANATEIVTVDERGREGWEITIAAPICCVAEDNLRS